MMLLKAIMDVSDREIYKQLLLGMEENKYFQS